MWLVTFYCVDESGTAHSWYYKLNRESPAHSMAEGYARNGFWKGDVNAPDREFVPPGAIRRVTIAEIPAD